MIPAAIVLSINDNMKTNLKNPKKQKQTPKPQPTYQERNLKIILNCWANQTPTSVPNNVLHFHPTPHTNVCVPSK